MRIIGGEARGRRLHTRPGLSTRPTADRVKESVFNILTPWIPGTQVLDLFAGSGALGLEAISRSAENVLFVDQDSGAIEIIRANIDLVRAEHKCDVWRSEVAVALQRLHREGRSFDLIFLDPPYNMEWVGRTIAMIAERGLMRSAGVLIAEHSGHELPESVYVDLSLWRREKYGETRISFFRKTDTISQREETNQT